MDVQMVAIQQHAPPPKPLPFLILAGRLAQRATTGYPLAVPKLESFVLSAYRMKQKGCPPVGIRDYNEGILVEIPTRGRLPDAYLYVPEGVR
jgi:hypothetical protein